MVVTVCSGRNCCTKLLLGLTHKTCQVLWFLQLLDLEDNCLTDWAEVMHVSRLPCLKHLWLGGNKLQHVQLPPGMLPSRPMHCFTHVLMLPSTESVEDNHTHVLLSVQLATAQLLTIMPAKPSGHLSCHAS